MIGLHIDQAFHGLAGLAILFWLVAAAIIAILVVLLVLTTRAQRTVPTNRTTGWGFGWQWLVGTSLGFVAGSVLSGFIPATNLLLDALGSGIVLGGIVGFIQWSVLRRRFTGARSWIIASALGFALASVASVRSNAFGIFSILGNSDFSPRSLVWPLATGGVVGGSQWVWMRQRVAAAGWWVVATAAGFELSAIVAPLIADLVLPLEISMILLTVLEGSGLLTGLVVGATTGVTLVWLPRRDLGS